MMRAKTFVVLVILVLLGSACRNMQLQASPVLNTEIQNQSPKYLFVEYWTSIIGTTSKERCNGYSYWDGPGYSYEANVLRSSFDVDLTESVSILGCGKQLSDPVGTGVFSNLYEIKAFPYTPDWADFCQTLTITKIDPSGTVSAKISGKVISLPVGQEWTNNVTDNSDSSCEKVTTYRLTNFGFINANQVVVSKK